MGNHDQRRVASRLGVARTDALNMILLSLPGASISYMVRKFTISIANIFDYIFFLPGRRDRND
jgi:hypothetical protein